MVKNWFVSFSWEPHPIVPTSFFLKKICFYVSEWCTWIYVYELLVCLVLTAARREHQMPWNWSYRWSQAIGSRISLSLQPSLQSLFPTSKVYIARLPMKKTIVSTYCVRAATSTYCYHFLKKIIKSHCDETVTVVKLSTLKLLLAISIFIWFFFLLLLLFPPLTFEIF